MGKYRYRKPRYWNKRTSSRIWMIYRVKSLYYRIKKRVISFLSFLWYAGLILCVAVMVFAYVMPDDSPTVSIPDVKVIYPDDNFIINVPDVRVVSPDNVLNIVGADGHRITLKNNVSAKDPSYMELRNFLRADETDKIQYDYGSFVCADFAETVHNNAENVGIKAGFVSVDFNEITDGHACNVFNTTDRGFVFIDCTGYRDGYYGNCDTIVDMKIGEKYKVNGLFGSRKYYVGYNNEDLTVKTYEIYW